MIGLARIVLAGPLLILGIATAAAEPPDPPAKVDVAAAYEAHEAHGFNVMFNKRLADRDAILRCIDGRLKDIVRVVPATHLSILRDVTVWVEPGKESKIPASLVEKTAAFYSPVDEAYDPLLYGLPAECRGGVVVVADGFLGGRVERWAAESTPGWLLHEMAHALHERILGYDFAPAKTAHRQAMDRKLYDEVEYRVFKDLGQIWVGRGPAYARSNEIEYFAELSVAYLNLSTGYFPFTRDDLADHDPGGYALMDAFWRPVKYKIVNEFPFPVSIVRRTETRRRYMLGDLLPDKEMTFDQFEGISLVAIDRRDGAQFRLDRPEKGSRTWRLSAATTSPFVDFSIFLQRLPR